ncbi:MAG TPA: vitamin K epoxide reductase family protein [Pyrinomonadaceae bacterium]|nr:vitamin K epoxide reductase family protein [Pyrinomonadaceae bacterium]
MLNLPLPANNGRGSDEVSIQEETNKPTSQRRAAILFGLAALVSLIGLGDAIYLTVEHLSGRSVRCTIVHGCSEVLSSPYATVKGFPLAGVGALAYFVVFSGATLAAFGYKVAGKFALLLSSLMFLFTLWLVYLQAFVIKAFCQFCLLSALVTTVMTVLLVMANRTRAH